MGRLQAEFPGFFTAAKASPYDAAAWAVIVQGLGIARAARIKAAVARDLGDARGRALRRQPRLAEAATIPLLVER